MSYSKELIIGAFLYRFEKYLLQAKNLEVIANKFYDENGRDEFRKAASVTPEAIQEYKNWLETI